ncbi:TlpA family protein disulfide reductase, partial [Ilumatobacter sp.]|uniref:TlpA family protein disulfide reductase n=1 Tax=Ilumatobacter sp. TaxID=1967498 RepID=UPI003C3AEBD1
MTEVADAPGDASDDIPDETDDDPGSGYSSRGKSKVAPFAALAIAVVLVGLVVLLIGAEPDDGAQTAATPWMNQPAPEAVGELGDGTPFDLARRKGSWVVLNFFQSDCVPCQREHPELVDFVEQQESLGPDGAEFYSVVFGDTQARVERFFEQNGGDWPVVYSDGDVIPASFGVNLVPETWII